MPKGLAVEVYVIDSVEVQAVHFAGTEFEARMLAKWCGGPVETGCKHGLSRVLVPLDTGCFAYLCQGDWLIRENCNKYYPCTDRVFKKIRQDTERQKMIYYNPEDLGRGCGFNGAN